MTEESLAPLLSRLAPERYRSSPARGGEAYDSTRWPLARDVALARWIAGRDDDLAVARALAELAAADVDLTRLRALARVAYARMIAACGGDTSMFTQLCTDATPADLAVFAEPRGDAATAGVIAELCSVHHAAADGLYAYHVHRRIPGPSAEAAARLAQGALGLGRITVSELVAAALALLPAEGS